MPAVLGIDAAWVEHHPSGVALIRQDAGGVWQFVAVAPSYDAFIQKAGGRPVNWDETPAVGLPEPERLLAAARQLLRPFGGETVTLVSVDMPLSKEAIACRRKSDRKISRKFGGRGCSTHSPSSTIPGKIADQLRQSLARLDYPLAVKGSKSIDRAVIEVYPHTALLRLLNLGYRLPYKVTKSNSKSRGYWRGKPAAKRAENLLAKFRQIYAGLDKEIKDICDFLPGSPYAGSLKSLKRFEDALDALVCAWVGARYLAGCATAYGDDTAAIWVPNDRANSLPPDIQLIRADKDPRP